MILKTEPKGYIPCDARLIHGWSGSLNISVNWVLLLKLLGSKALGSNLGEDAIAKILPVSRSITTIAPRKPEIDF